MVEIDWVLAEFQKRDDCVSQLENETGLAMGAADTCAKIAEDDLRKSIEAHGLYAVENFATEGGLTRVVNRANDEIKWLTDPMDRYFEKGDGSPPRCI
jgi:hypothetical protein